MLSLSIIDQSLVRFNNAILQANKERILGINLTTAVWKKKIPEQNQLFKVE